MNSLAILFVGRVTVPQMCGNTLISGTVALSNSVTFGLDVFGVRGHVGLSHVITIARFGRFVKGVNRPAVGGKPPSGSFENKTVSTGANAEGTLPKVAPPEELTLCSVKLSSDRTNLEAVSFRLELFQVGNSQGLLKKLQIAKHVTANFEAHEAVGVNKFVTTASVPSGNNFAGVEVRNGFLHSQVVFDHVLNIARFR